MNNEEVILKREGLDTLNGAFAYTGGQELSKPGLGTRRRFRLQLTDESGETVQWYMKRYGPIPWRKRLGRTSPARREFENIRRLQTGNVPTMNAVTMGEERDALGRRRSYIIVTAVPGEALERCFDDFLARNGSDEQKMEQFNTALVKLISALHASGNVHRDLYASHIFMDETPTRLKLYLIDLARVFAPKRRTFRWRVKDLAQLKYSMPTAWTEKYWNDLLQRYLFEAQTASPQASPSYRPCCELFKPVDCDRWSAAIDRKIARMRQKQRKKISRDTRDTGDI